MDRVSGIPHIENKVLSSSNDTALTPEQMPNYERWRDKLPEDMDRTGKDYDLQGAYLAGESTADNGHLTDKFKKPNHPTFSDESQYSQPGNMGGHWSLPASGSNPGQKPSYVFRASEDQMKTNTPESLNNYFAQQEPNSVLVTPLPGVPHTSKGAK